ncbi:HAMP domain-containing protein [Pseudanabaena sp. FACHB-1277]|uniref:HAMP domain-containing protein n=1 Tax=Pseudanabaena cinerea FACHB-1277 TaxID=2949581 RepID=A0A926UUG7_9CYAN|nr:methyl-accepting chemotaxis protein [Pseudanabaena cinerea]MBD2151590.1 HAMP domain-containing protein [Pseudanabaena cinerea FACHB-1277]
MLTQKNQSQNQSQNQPVSLQVNQNAADFPQENPDIPMSLENLLSPEESLVKTKRKTWSWRSLSLRSKSTILAIMIGSLPVLLTGIAGYLIADNTVSEKVKTTHTQATQSTADKINRFMFERYGDAQVLANLPIFTDPKARKIYSLAERSEILTKYAENYGVYDSIAVFDLQGNTIVQMRDGKPISNYSDRPYFQEAIKTGKPVLNPPAKSKSSGKVSIEIAAPIRDSESNQIIGALRTRIPVKVFEDLISTSADKDSGYKIIDAKGIIFVSRDKDVVGKPLREVFEGIDSLIANNKADSETSVKTTNGGFKLVGYAPTTELAGLPKLNWKFILTADEDVAFKALSELSFVFLLGGLVSAVVAGLVAALLANRAIKPIREAASVVEKIGQGDLDSRLAVESEDELGVLSSNINGMVEQLKYLSEAQQQEAERLENARREARAEADARAEEQKQEKELLQRRALELLMEVDPVSQGDLTIRANVTADEVGTIADSYNAIIRNLRKLVLEVQSATQSVTQTASDNEISVRSVSNEAVKQSVAINLALEEIKLMAESSRGVEDKAKQAERGMQVAVKVLQEGDDAMNSTVLGISEIRETVAETAKKVKRLGETSQKISRIVNLISNFAAQTNLLALNAAIEAARAGEEGRGFSVVAEEVRDLAEQSANSTAEIEQLVEEIQAQTNEVVAAMETGTEQVVSGTKLVQNAREKLTQISMVSKQVNSLVQSIAVAADTQTKTSDRIGESMQNIAAIAEDTSKQSEDVAQSFSELLQVAQDLKVSVSQFKVA